MLSQLQYGTKWYSLLLLGLVFQNLLRSMIQTVACHVRPLKAAFLPPPPPPLPRTLGSVYFFGFSKSLVFLDCPDFLAISGHVNYTIFSDLEISLQQGIFCSYM